MALLLLEIIARMEIPKLSVRLGDGETKQRGTVQDATSQFEGSTHNRPTIIAIRVWKGPGLEGMWRRGGRGVCP